MAVAVAPVAAARGGGGGGGGGGGPAGPLSLDSSTGTTCAVGALPLCPFVLQGEGADALVGTVTGGGGVTLAAGATVTILDGGWTAVGVYGCEADGFLRVSIGGEVIDVPINCAGV